MVSRIALIVYLSLLLMLGLSACVVSVSSRMAFVRPWFRCDWGRFPLGLEVSYKTVDNDGFLQGVD